MFCFRLLTISPFPARRQSRGSETKNQPKLKVRQSTYQNNFFCFVISVKKSTEDKIEKFSQPKKNQLLVF